MKIKFEFFNVINHLDNLNIDLLRSLLNILFLIDLINFIRILCHEILRKFSTILAKA